MAKVLTTSSSVKCGHGPGLVQASGASKLTVGGAQVLLRDGVSSKSIGGCTTVPSSDTSGPVDVTCQTVTSITAGESTKLFVGGQAVLLDTLKGGTSGVVGKTPAQALSAQANQQKLEAQ